eukprot:1161719-Pelagomonas_calceolata.AAC.11
MGFGLSSRRDEVGDQQSEGGAEGSGVRGMRLSNQRDEVRAWQSEGGAEGPGVRGMSCHSMTGNNAFHLSIACNKIRTCMKWFAHRAHPAILRCSGLLQQMRAAKVQEGTHGDNMKGA